MSLNPEQHEAVNTIYGALVVLAGAGTGKTKVITERVVHLLNRGVRAERIVALTFTNKAAKEMRERIERSSKISTEGLFVGTFHSYCLNLMRKHPEFFELGKGFTIIGMSDQVDIVRKCLEERGLMGAMQPRQALFQISQLKNSTISDSLRAQIPADLLSQASSADALTQDLCTLYSRQLRMNHAIDFDDCILNVTNALCQSAEFSKLIRSQTDFVLVDEFQDTNFLQLDLVYQIAAHHKNVCVVGDDDQSIYSWRGAVPRNIEIFENLFAPSKLIKLEQNYRCTDKILSAANSLIEKNAHRKDKRLWSQKITDSPPYLLHFHDDGEEAEWIARRIIALRGSGLKSSEIAVLYRSGNLARALEAALRSSHIEYKIFGGESFFERKEVRDFLSYVRLAVDKSNRLAFWRILNVPNRRLGLKAAENIEMLSRQKKLPPLVTLHLHSDELPTNTKQHAQQFAQLMQNLSSMPTRTPEDVLALGVAILRATDLERDARLRTQDLVKQQRKIAMIRGLPQWLADLCKSRFLGNGKIDFKQIVEELLTESSEGSEKDERKDYVSLMTIHSSKGLEFPAVFVVGLEDDSLPHQNSIAEGKVDEERRLFYVAITRAKQQLFVTTAGRRSAGQSTQEKSLSRFIREIPPDFMKVEEPNGSVVSGEKEIEVMKKQTIGRLSALRSELSTKRPTLRF
jgi:superfamily I DNA/RNA helicase